MIAVESGTAIPVKISLCIKFLPFISRVPSVFVNAMNHT
jgi:hypothetical protein